LDGSVPHWIVAVCPAATLNRRNAALPPLTLTVDPEAPRVVVDSG
jgi:hypothetical protein